LQFRHGVKAGAPAGCVISGLWREPPSEYTGGEVPHSGDLHSRVFLRGDGGLAWGRDAALTRGRSCRSLLAAQIAPRGFSGPLVSQ
jgi:hypothetical protein